MAGDTALDTTESWNSPRQLNLDQLASTFILAPVYLRWSIQMTLVGLGSRPLIGTQKTILRIRYAQRVKTPPNTKLDELQAPKASKSPAVIQIAKLGFPEAVPFKDSAERTSGIHPIRYGKRVLVF
jgi:hypothetical protein